MVEYADVGGSIRQQHTALEIAEVRKARLQLRETIAAGLAIDLDRASLVAEDHIPVRLEMSEDQHPSNPAENRLKGLARMMATA